MAEDFVERNTQVDITDTLTRGRQSSILSPLAPAGFLGLHSSIQRSRLLVLGICWSHSSSLGVTALSALIGMGVLGSTPNQGICIQ